MDDSFSGGGDKDLLPRAKVDDDADESVEYEQRQCLSERQVRLFYLLLLPFGRTTRFLTGWSSDADASVSTSSMPLSVSL